MGHIHIESIRLANGKNYKVETYCKEHFLCSRCALSQSDCCGSLKRMCSNGSKKYLVEIKEDDTEEY